MNYIVICTLYNGNVIHAFASTFKSATDIAVMFKHGDYTSSVEIITISTRLVNSPLINLSAISIDTLKLLAEAVITLPFTSLHITIYFISFSSCH